MRLSSPGLLAVIALSAALVTCLLWVSSLRNEKTAAPPEPAGNARNDAATEPADAVPTTQRAGSLQNDVPIVFYGRLEDQGAEPVAEADVFGTIVFHQGTATATNHYSTRSDEGGFFRLAGGIGESLELLARKPGYALASTNTIAFYGRSRPEPERHHPDPGQPVIIKMWKLQGAEPLATFSQRFTYYPGETPLLFDFVTQTSVLTNGDIKIKINRPPGAIPANERPEWSVEVESVNGGLMEINSATWATTYWAPVDGYQARQTLVVSTNGPHSWSTNAAAMYFVQTREGSVYTKLWLKASINLDPNTPAAIALYGVVNTNGSCNWEADSGTLNQQ